MLFDLSEYLPQEPLEKTDKKRFKPNFTLEQLRERRRSVAQLLNNPLILRTFLEVYAGKGLPDLPSLEELMSNWFSRLSSITNDNNQFLLDVTSIFLEKKKHITKTLTLQKLLKSEKKSELAGLSQELMWLLL